MYLQNTTAGIFGVGLGVSCSRGRENRTLEIVALKHSRLAQKAAFTAGFILVKALWQLKFFLADPCIQRFNTGTAH